MGVLLLGLGSFLLASAALLPLYVYPRVAVLPTDPQVEQVMTAEQATMLVVDATAPAGARELRNADVTVTTFVTAAPVAEDDVDADTVVWQFATEVTVAGRGMTSAQVEWTSLDRRTHETTNCCGDRIVTTADRSAGEPLQHKGLVAWPLDVQKRTYQLWDLQLRGTRPATYVREERRDGIDTYVFDSVVTRTKVGNIDLPGGLFGVKDPSVNATSWYADSRRYWIEPATGDVIALRQDQSLTYTYGGRTVTSFDAELESRRMSDARLDRTRTGALALTWLRGRAAMLLVPLGALLVAGGIVLLRRRRPE
ncbi:porin PorA family protein [Cryptosporangium minutisporangium]|uniref:DUF3068 domain-containing protein n=1 Tax=Cryptosporangium minutisporangium TaxID=113569 RepID=A0ABP6SR92_9ACTN